jgi:WD40 repeat protein
MSQSRSTSARFDAFISYSHDADHGLATLLGRRLERIATPWYGRRRLRVFCDRLTLGAQSLDDTIRSAMDDSRYLIVLASPEAAASRWVAAESEYWLAEHRDAAARVLIVLTEGILHWNPAARSYEGNCLPRPLLKPGVFGAERKWVDLRGTNLANPASSDDLLGDAVAEVAAELLGTTKDAVRGQEVTARRRARRALAGALSVLVAFMVAVVALAFQLRSSGEQVTQRELVARSRSLAAAALRETTPDLAPLLAAQALHEAPTQEAYDAVLQVLNRNPRLQVMHRVSGRPLHSDDHSRLLTLHGESLEILDLRSGATSAVPVRGVIGASMSSAGDLAISTDGQTSLWRPPFERPFATLPGTDAPRYTVDGRYLVVLRGNEARFLNSNDGKQARPPLPIAASIGACNRQVVATNNLGRLVVAACHKIEVWDLARRRVTARRIIAEGDNTIDTETEGITAVSLSPDGRYLAVGTTMVPRALDGSLLVVETRTLKPVTGTEGQPVDLDLSRHDGAVEDVTFDVAGQAVAVAASTPDGPGARSARFETLDLADGRLDVLGPEWPGAAAAMVQAGRSPGQFTSGDERGLVAQWDAARSDRVGQVLWRGSGMLLSAAATADGRTLAIRLAQQRSSQDPDGEVATDLKTLIVDHATGATRVLERSVDTESLFVGGGPDTSASPLLFSPDGRLLLSETGLWEVGSGRLMYPASVSSGVFSQDGTRLLLGKSNGAVVLLTTKGSLAVQRVFRLPADPNPDAPVSVIATAFAAHGAQVAAVSARGLVVRFDGASAHVLSTWTRQPTTDVVPQLLADAAFDEAGDFVALFASETGDTELYGAVDVAEVGTGRLRGTLDEAVSRGTFVDTDHLLMSDDSRTSLVLWGWSGEPVRAWMPLGRLDRLATVKPLGPELALLGVTHDDDQAEVIRVPLAAQALQRLACGVAGRDFTATEKGRYLQRQKDRSACASG